MPHRIGCAFIPIIFHRRLWIQDAPLAVKINPRTPYKETKPPATAEKAGILLFRIRQNGGGTGTLSFTIRSALREGNGPFPHCAPSMFFRSVLLYARMKKSAWQVKSHETARFHQGRFRRLCDPRPPLPDGSPESAHPSEVGSDRGSRGSVPLLPARGTGLRPRGQTRPADRPSSG